MIEIVIYIIIACLLVASTHIWSAIKSGCFYTAKRRDYSNLLMRKYCNNLHLVQTPFWYSLFGSLFFMLLAIFRIYEFKIFESLFLSYLIMQSISAICGPFYQGFVNIGSGKPFIDKLENKKRDFLLL